MKPWIWLSGAALALTGSLAVAAPQDLLPPVFNDPDPPAPAPAPRPANRPAPAPAPTPTASSRVTLPDGIPTTSREIVQEIPSDSGGGPSPAPSSGGIDLPAGFPSLAELERMEADEINAVLGLRPKFDVPPSARCARRA